ncbi:hypothetical protein OROHE_006719 [Orobanche hederae]
MESTNNTLSSGGGVTVVGSDATRTTNKNQPELTGPSPSPAAVAIAPALVSITRPPHADADAGVSGATILTKKRGRPRKYGGPDGSVSKALSPKPISSSVPPPVIDFSAVSKRGKVRPVGSVAAKVQPLRIEHDGLGK